MFSEISRTNILLSLFLRITATPWEWEGRTTTPYGDTQWQEDCGQTHVNVPQGHLPPAVSIRITRDTLWHGHMMEYHTAMKRTHTWYMSQHDESQKYQVEQSKPATKQCPLVWVYRRGVQDQAMLPHGDGSHKSDHPRAERCWLGRGRRGPLQVTDIPLAELSGGYVGTDIKLYTKL